MLGLNLIGRLRSGSAIRRIKAGSLIRHEDPKEDIIGFVDYCENAAPPKRGWLGRIFHWIFGKKPSMGVYWIQSKDPQRPLSAFRQEIQASITREGQKEPLKPAVLEWRVIEKAGKVVELGVIGWNKLVKSFFGGVRLIDALGKKHEIRLIG